MKRQKIDIFTVMVFIKICKLLQFTISCYCENFELQGFFAVFDMHICSIKRRFPFSDSDMNR